jgi:N-acetylglucosaminyldiphosphoundecaprenol N-acetyl-beta-D-mannosaminyltransferase
MNMQSAANTGSSTAPEADHHTDSRTTGKILGARIDALSWDKALDGIGARAAARESAYVCICNVHMVVTAALDPGFMKVVNGADLATPDGAPIAWALRRLGFDGQARINGPDLMWRYLKQAELSQQSVYFYGSTPETLAMLRRSLVRAFPQLHIAGMHSPPFRALTKQEDDHEIARIHHSGAHLVFVGMGCPKQEKWMAAHRGRINAVMIGVGAAFDYHAGVLKRAPLWWQQHGLEWLYRLLLEPRRLLRRYAVTNTLFVLGFGRQLIADWRLRRNVASAET